MLLTYIMYPTIVWPLTIVWSQPITSCPLSNHAPIAPTPESPKSTEPLKPQWLHAPIAPKPQFPNALNFLTQMPTCALLQCPYSNDPISSYPSLHPPTPIFLPSHCDRCVTKSFSKHKFGATTLAPITTPTAFETPQFGCSLVDFPFSATDLPHRANHIFKISVWILNIFV